MLSLSSSLSSTGTFQAGHSRERIFDHILDKDLETESMVLGLEAHLGAKKKVTKDEVNKLIKRQSARIARSKSVRGLEDWISNDYTINEYSPVQEGQFTPDPRRKYSGKLGIARKYGIDIGSKIEMTHSPSTKSPGGGKINDLLSHFGFKVLEEGPLEGDHILEWQLGGPDELVNLWPLDKKTNGKSGNALKNMVFRVPAGKKPLPRIKKITRTSSGAPSIYLSDIKGQLKNGSVWFKVVKTNG